MSQPILTPGENGLGTSQAKTDRLVSTPESAACYQNLREHQTQLDFDGVMVGVSRQALDETLEIYDALLALAGNLQRWLMKDVEKSHISADDMRVYHLDGGVLANLLDEARAALAKATGQ